MKNDSGPRIFLANQAQFEGIRTNLGERAIFSQMLKEIREHIPDAEISVLSSDLAYTKGTFNVLAVPLGGVRGAMNTLSAIFGCDVLIVGGGELIQDKSSLAMIPYILMRPSIAKILGKKVVAYGVGIGEDDEITSFGKLLSRLVMNKFDLITTRDTKSTEMLANMRINKPEIIQAADVANNLVPCHRERAEAILAKEGVYDIRRPKVTFSMRSVFHRTHSVLPFSYRKKLGLLPLEYHEKIKEFKQIIAQAADYVIEKYGADVLFIPAYKGEKLSAMDDTFSMEIIQIMKNKNQAFLIRGDYEPEEIKGLFSLAELLVAVPLHSLILSGSSGIPLIDINYASKGKAYMEQIGQEKYILHAENPSDNIELDALINMIDDVWLNRRSIKETINQKNKIIFKMAELNIEKLAELVYSEGVT